MTTANEYRERLECAGIRLEEARDLVVGVRLWEVSGRCLGRRLWAQGHTRDEAWRSAYRQAEALGLLPPAGSLAPGL